MTHRRSSARLVRWTSPLWSSLLLAGCESAPRTSDEPLAIKSEFDSRVPANSALRPCVDPRLQSPAAQQASVLATSHPAPVGVERLPLVPRPFPTIDAEVPLSAMLSRQGTPRSARTLLQPIPTDGPALMSPGGASADAEFAPPPPPQVSEEKASELRRATNGPERIRSTPISAKKPAGTAMPLPVRPEAGAASPPAPWLLLEPPAAANGSAAAPPAPLPSRAGESREALPLQTAPRPSPSAVVEKAQEPARSAEIEAVARQAERQVRRGFDLAARGALYSARAQFIQALRTICQALDIRSGDDRHSEALSAGLGALEEAEDFVPRGSRLEADLDIGLLVQGHRTPVLKKAAREELVAVAAQQQYYTHAQEQLTLAAGGEEAGSMALFGLGKTYGTLAEQRSPQVVAPEPKAMVFHQAALKAAPGNYLAANELAVLAARYGRYEAARDLLQHSAALAPRPEIWRNLAVVHRRLGETQLAALAEKQAATAAQQEAAGKLPRGAELPSEVQWVDAKAFASTTKPASDLQKPAESSASDPDAAQAPDESAAAPWLRQTAQPAAPRGGRR